LERSDRERVMATGRRDDRHRGEIVAPDQVHRVGIYPVDCGFSGGFVPFS
jgi:hypothetical protein